MASIGITYNRAGQGQPNGDLAYSFDLHINYWKLPQSWYEKYNRFVDIGVMCHDCLDEITSVNVYVPFKVENNQLTDLGIYLKDEKLASTLFNEECGVNTQSDSPGYYLVTLRGEESVVFWLYELRDTNFECKKLQHGTLITITIKTKPNKPKEIPAEIGNSQNVIATKKLYIRFRISDISVNDWVFTESISNDFIQSAFSKIEMLNLHVNEIREMDSDDYQDWQNSGVRPTLSKVHFFFIASSQEESVYGKTQYIDCRLLSPNKWNSYIGNNNPLKRKCIAYHWKSSMVVQHYNVFMRSTYSAIDGCKLLKYGSVVVILGLLGSLIANLLSK